MNDYKFSVIIPAYNSEAFIGETVECLLAQTLGDIQIIIVDDGSADGTGAIIDAYAKEHENIVAVHQKNGGVSAARNNGIAHADGKYLMFNDSDDLLGENTLELIYERMEKHNADMAIFRLRRFGFGSEEDNPVALELSEEEKIDCFDTRVLWNFPIGNKAFRTESLKKSGVLFAPLSYSEDGAFNMSFIYTFMPKITGVPGAVAKYRRCDPEIHPSVTQSISMKYINDFCSSLDIVTEKAKAAFENEKCTCKDKKQYLEEIIKKRYCTLMNEFYRLLWNTDDETLAFLSEKCMALRSEMTAESLKSCDTKYKELGLPLSSKTQAASQPKISITVRAAEPAPEFIRSLYHQSMPLFEVITKGNAGEKHENIRTADSKPKGEIKITLTGKKAVDSRLLRVIYFLKTNRLFGLFPDFLIKQGAFVFLKFFQGKI